MNTNYNRICIALAVRIGIALCTRTFFQPDEYFQALEPAHALVFGYGHLTWEWLTPRPIRSILYSGLTASVFWLLQLLGSDRHVWLLIAGPRILHGCLAALTDIWTAHLATKIAGERYASLAYTLSLVSTFHALSLSRSLSNSLETSLTTVAFAYYPWDASSNLSHTLIFNRSACLAVQILSDSAYFGKPTFTAFNFLLTNLSSVSVFYGSNAWHFYLTAALPILCMSTLPYVVLGIRKAFMHSKRDSGSLQLASYTLAWTISIYSLAKHKEWRFIHPLLPLMYVLAAKWIVDEASQPQKDANSSKYRKAAIPRLRGLPTVAIWAQLPISIFLVLVYCRAPISVMGYLRGLPSEELSQSIGLLMPCHSTPGHAYLHREELRDGKLWSIGCEPPLRGETLTTYRDQTDIFYESPMEYILEYFPSSVDPSFPVSKHPATLAGSTSVAWSHEWPRHLVFFGQLLGFEGVEELLLGLGYNEVWRRGFDWEGDDKRKGGVRVWKWQYLDCAFLSVDAWVSRHDLPLSNTAAELPAPGPQSLLLVFFFKVRRRTLLQLGQIIKAGCRCVKVGLALCCRFRNSRYPRSVCGFCQFKLHQFFSLHRPLLLLSEPSTLLQTAPTKGPLYASKAAPEDSLPPPPPIGKYGTVFDDAPVFSTEADSETARQLMRSLTLNRAGGAVAWDETLQRLGLVTEVDPHTMEQMKQDWNDVMMDSTKRKRRKKMKKHKLKKRRRATRATRLKIGR
ncbi:hypothetical protein ONZ45_g16249 [Pleurotus djamor]|nr:hypothetical protein ONZ45_g16249 [Pleurotus djamor]